MDCAGLCFAGLYRALLCRAVLCCVGAEQTKQWIGELKMNGSVREVVFSADGRYMFSFGSECVQKKNSLF